MLFNINGTANNVADCLKSIENFRDKNKLSKCTFFYRGEADDYKNYSLESKLFRPIIEHPKDTEYGNLLLYFIGSREFYRETNQFNRKIDRDFMAYCQHHGLPTPLLDITSSVLVGLYFACCKKPTVPGFLFLFKNDKFLKYPSKYLDHNSTTYTLNPYNNLKILVSVIYEYEHSDVFNEDFLIQWTKMRQNIVNEFKVYYKNLNKDEIYNNAINDLYKMHSLSDLGSKLRIDILNNDYKSLTDLSKNYIKFLESIGFIKDARLLRETQKYPQYFYEFTDEALLYTFYLYMSRHKGKFNLPENSFIPSDLNFYVRTHYDWDRMKAQNGCFIIECPKKNQQNKISLLGKRENRYSTVNYNNHRFIHDIKPDYVLKLTDKDNIIKELHDFGINSSTLFRDPDHIAKYIQDKYFFKR